MHRLYDLFIKLDCTQVEVNPLAETPDGKGTPNQFSTVIFIVR